MFACQEEYQNYPLKKTIDTERVRPTSSYIVGVLRERE